MIYNSSAHLIAWWNIMSHILYMCIHHVAARHGAGYKTSALVGTQGEPLGHCLALVTRLLSHTIRSVINAGASEDSQVTYRRLASNHLKRQSWRWALRDRHLWGGTGSLKVIPACWPWSSSSIPILWPDCKLEIFRSLWGSTRSCTLFSIIAELWIMDVNMWSWGLATE